MSRSRHRMRRSRDLARLTKREQGFVERQLAPERRQKYGPAVKLITPCLDCGRQLRRKWDVVMRTWSPFCVDCWVARGRPSMEESRVVAKEVREVHARAEREQVQREIDAGERPW